MPRTSTHRDGIMLYYFIYGLLILFVTVFHYNFSKGFCAAGTPFPREQLFSFSPLCVADAVQPTIAWTRQPRVRHIRHTYAYVIVNDYYNTTRSTGILGTVYDIYCSLEKSSFSSVSFYSLKAASETPGSQLAAAHDPPSLLCFVDRGCYSSTVVVYIYKYKYYCFV